MTNKKLKTVFVIAPISSAGSDTRDRSDKVLRHIIAPAVAASGYGDPIRSDHIDEPGLITSQIVQRIIDSDLVVADLTDHNPNVFYELAIRHAIGKPVIQIISSDDDIPFDVGQLRTIRFDYRDLDSVSAAIQQIKNQIESADSKDALADNPIGRTLEVQSIRANEGDNTNGISLVLDRISRMERSIDQLTSRVELPQRSGILNRPTNLAKRRREQIELLEREIYTSEEQLQTAERQLRILQAEFSEAKTARTKNPIKTQIEDLEQSLNDFHSKVSQLKSERNMFVHQA